MDDPLTGRQRIADDEHAGGARDLDAAGAAPINANAAAGRTGATGQLRRLPGRAGSAAAREIAGQQRDLAAGARDRAAGERDVQAQARDALSDKLREVAGHARVSSGRDVILRAAKDRERAFEDRAHAAEQRAQAALDREHAARDRLLCAADRAAAIRQEQDTDRDGVSDVLAPAAGLPALVLAPAAGLSALAREIDRAHRTDGDLTVVYVTTGDATPCDVARALLSCVRSYDLVIAVSADAFVCALTGAAIDTALARFASIERTLTATGVAITIGYAELASSDTPATLIDGAVADAPTTRLASDQHGAPGRALHAVPATINGRLTR